MKKVAKCLLLFAVAIGVVYGLGRLYFHVTDGFTLANIHSDFAFQPQWEVRPLVEQEQLILKDALAQPYHYLGKGCQSYVFASEDGQYVIKFFKYQRYRLQPWLAYFPPLPAIVQYRQQKLAKKWNQLNIFVTSWKVAFENLKSETGLIFVHLNKTKNLQTQLTLYDKIHRLHTVDLDQMEFCVQRRVALLSDTLLTYQSKGDLIGAQQLIHRLLTMIVSEYAHGLADQDHALLQNTGVVDGQPVHIDVGQFVYEEAVKQPAVFHQELFTKTYRFKVWLQEHYPEAGQFLEKELIQIIGPSYEGMQPKFRPKR